MSDQEKLNALSFPTTEGFNPNTGGSSVGGAQSPQVDVTEDNRPGPYDAETAAQLANDTPQSEANNADTLAEIAVMMGLPQGARFSDLPALVEKQISLLGSAPVGLDPKWKEWRDDAEEAYSRLVQGQHVDTAELCTKIAGAVEAGRQAEALARMKSQLAENCLHWLEFELRSQKAAVAITRAKEAEAEAAIQLEGFVRTGGLATAQAAVNASPQDLPLVREALADLSAEDPIWKQEVAGRFPEGDPAPAKEEGFCPRCGLEVGAGELCGRCPLPMALLTVHFLSESPRDSGRVGEHTVFWVVTRPIGEPLTDAPYSEPRIAVKGRTVLYSTALRAACDQVCNWTGGTEREAMPWILKQAEDGPELVELDIRSETVAF